jgi:hypothetical protein
LWTIKKHNEASNKGHAGLQTEFSEESPKAEYIQQPPKNTNVLNYATM